MERSTVTQMAKSGGAKVLWYDKNTSCYQFSTEDQLFNFREKVPFVTVWTNNNRLNVFFDQVKDY